MTTVPGESGRMKAAPARFPADSPTKWADLPSKCEASSPACFSPLLTEQSPTKFLQTNPTHTKIPQSKKLRSEAEILPFQSSDLTVDLFFGLLGSSSVESGSLLSTVIYTTQQYCFSSSAFSFLFLYILLFREKGGTAGTTTGGGRGRGRLGFFWISYSALSLSRIYRGRHVPSSWMARDSDRRGAPLVLPNCPPSWPY